MNSCPCCSHQLLRHIRHQEIYWFCTSCRQEMPNLDSSLKNDNYWRRLNLNNNIEINFSPCKCLNQRLLVSTSKTVRNLTTD